MLIFNSRKVLRNIATTDCGIFMFSACDHFHNIYLKLQKFPQLKQLNIRETYVEGTCKKNQITNVGISIVITFADPLRIGDSAQEHYL